MRMVGSMSSETAYNYGFQGQEIDDDIFEGAVRFKHRIHDARLGRYLSIDPLSSQYPFYSHYSFSGNNVINSFELEGAQPGHYLARLYYDHIGKHLTIERIDYSLYGSEHNFGIFIANSGIIAWNGIVSIPEDVLSNSTPVDLYVNLSDIYESVEQFIDRPWSEIETDLEAYLTDPETYETLAAAILTRKLSRGLSLPQTGWNGKLKELTLKEVPITAKNTPSPTTTPVSVTIPITSKLIRYSRVSKLEDVNLLTRGSASKYKGKSGVYVHKFKDGSIYVGKAKDLGRRPKASLRELQNKNGKHKGGAENKDYAHTEFYELDKSLYDDLDHMEGDFLNNKYGGITNDKVLNKRQADHWDNYKDR